MYINTFTFGKIPLEMWEVPMLLFMMFLVLLFGGIIKHRNLRKHPEYEYFMLGLWAKVFGGLFFAVVYVFFYREGDTFSYYECALSFKNLLFKDVSDFWYAYMSGGTEEIKSIFTEETGEPVWYIFKEDKTRFVTKLLVPFVVAGGGSYFLSTILVSIFTYGGLWNLYRVFVSHFPDQRRNLAIGILFMPSVLCWGSGILKDSFTLAATCYFIAATNQLITKRGSLFWNIVILLLSGWMIASIKAYILIILLPGTLVWYFYSSIRKIKNALIRTMAIPLIYFGVIVMSVTALSQLSDQLGRFSLQNMLETAVVTQQDLKRDYYEGNSFDIGDFEPTAVGVSSKFPAATAAGLYRPYIWESNNVAMLLSGIENFFILLLTVLVLVTIKRRVIVSMIADNPIILYSFIFSILFAFMIGLTTSNFGALVRFKIPLIPLYMASIMVILGQTKSIKIFRSSAKTIR
jgi:hypothetical protein